MSRTQKKCFIASTGVHLLLLLVLLFGPAFISSKDKSENTEVLDFIPAMAIDGQAFNRGGAPAPAPTPAPTPQPQVAQAAPPPPVVPPTPAPKPEPEKISEPEPPKNLKPNPEALEADKPPKTKPKPQISTKIVTRNADDLRKAAQKQAEQNAAKERQQLANALGKAATSLKTDLSGSTQIKFSDGLGVGGGSGPAYANWFSILQTIYDRAWEVPDSINDDSANVKASVTIARDGTVLSWSIVTPSGNSTVDRSVRAALESVTHVSALPATAKEEQRTVIINFNLKAHKQLLG